MTQTGLNRLAGAWMRAQEAYDRGDITEQQWNQIFATSRLIEDHPQKGWNLILEVLRREPNSSVCGMLAAGPLEALIYHHGSLFIGSIEAQARSDPEFSNVLRGVWLTEHDDAVTRRYADLGCGLVRASEPSEWQKAAASTGR